MSKMAELMWAWAVILALGALAFLLLGLYNFVTGQPTERRAEVVTDREHVEAGAQKIEAFCRANPDAC